MPVAPPKISTVATVEMRLCGLAELLGRLVPVPSEWLGSNAGAGSARAKGSTLECLPCESYREIISAWRKALKWTDNLDCALSCMLASSMSTNLVGEQLWFKILGPPSCGKTTILEGLSLNKEYILSKDSIRGFYSGWKSDDGSDDSIASLAKGKTLATKDGDTLLKAPNLTQILSEARGIYDRNGRTHYRNQVSTDYEGLRMTWILCGTSSLREIDDSELGARFIDCVVMDDIDDDFEDDVAWRAANAESNAMRVESNGDASTQYPPDLALAMQLTGGYVTYLRVNAVDLISQVQTGEEQLRRCAKLGKFIAFARARPGKNEDADREFSARLVKQIVRLSQALAVVLNRTTVDEEVMRRVTKVALDTSRGQSLDIMRLLYPSIDGLPGESLNLHTNGKQEETRKLLRYLKKIGVVELNTAPAPTGAKLAANRYILTQRIRKLYSEVLP